MNKKEETYNKLIARDGQDYIFLESIFHYDDGMCGATGFVMRPISEQEYNDEDSILEYYDECWRSQVASGTTDLGLQEWIDANVYDTDERFDTSFLYNDDVEEQLRVHFPNVDETPLFEATGCGRMFSSVMAFEQVYDMELMVKIIAVEMESEKKRQGAK